jgi:hypothetical protein
LSFARQERETHTTCSSIKNLANLFGTKKREKEGRGEGDKERSIGRMKTIKRVREKRKRGGRQRKARKTKHQQKHDKILFGEIRRRGGGEGEEKSVAMTKNERVTSNRPK